MPSIPWRLERNNLLFPDQATDAQACLGRWSPEGKSCLVAYARGDVLATGLHAAGAQLVWTSDREPTVADYPRCRFVCGDLAWLWRHPRLARARTEPFDAVYCSSGLWRFLAGEAELLAALSGAHKLLRSGGRLHITTPQTSAPRTPFKREIAGDTSALSVLCLTQRIGEQRVEARFVAGEPPNIDRGIDLPADVLAAHLRASGFDDVSTTPYDPDGASVVSSTKE